MLTADLVNARRRGSELHLIPLDSAARDSAQAIARALVRAASGHVGRTREELEASLESVDVGPREHRLRDGLAKLTLDRCVFDASDEIDPEALRREAFIRASEVRAGLDGSRPFDRDAVLDELSRGRGVTRTALERALFADLRGAHVLLSFDAPGPERLVAEYERAQAQAVLLRAVSLKVDVRCASASALRALFHRLRFLRLLHAIAPTDHGHRITIDGPFSLFESVTKYGLSLAMLLPALEQCDAWRLEADVRWGKDRVPLVFRASGRGTSEGAMEPELLPEVLALRASFAALETPWDVRPNADILELPGIGLSVPDLVFERRASPSAKKRADSPRMSSRKREGTDRVYLEVMGYWSRAAVWRRVELVQAGLLSRVLFAVGTHLRVSEDVLEEDSLGALYVYKRTMSARAVAKKIDRLWRAKRGHGAERGRGAESRRVP